MAVFYSKRCTRGKELLLLVVGYLTPLPCFGMGRTKVHAPLGALPSNAAFRFIERYFAPTPCRQRQAAPQTIAGTNDANRGFRQARHKSRTPHRAAQSQATAETFTVKIAVRLGQVCKLPGRI